MIRKLILIFLLGSPSFFRAQNPLNIPTKGLQGYWQFSGNANDLSGNNRNGRVFGATLVKDRFGNENGAYSFNGTTDYISTLYPGILGAHPRAVSFWAMVKDSVKSMPAITWGDNTQYPDNGHRFGCGFNWITNEQGAAVGISDAGLCFEVHHKINNDTWHHYVYQFNKKLVKEVEVYQDGVLLTHEVGDFYPETYIDTWAYANVQFAAVHTPEQSFYFTGVLDDIAIYDRVLSQNEIKELYRSPDPIKKQNTKQLILILLVVILVILFVIATIRFSVKKIVAREKEKTRQKNQWYEQENRILQAQMDPHFIFNSLNTIQQFIISNDNEKAQLYLSKFSRLVRKLLESNSNDSVSLKDEKELYEKYLEIESLRFNNVFDYEVVFDAGLDLDNTFIPRFLVQPFIENAIWHGLLPKTGHKDLDIIFEKIDENVIRCIIEDNGIGRKNSADIPKFNGEVKTKRLGIGFVKQRLLNMSKMDKREYYVSISDKLDASGNSTGTKVIIQMPIIKQN